MKSLFIAVVLVVVLYLVVTGKIFEIKLPSVNQPPQKMANVLYPPNPDPSGRNIYYLAYSPTGDVKFSGVGIHQEPIGSQYKDQNGKVILTTINSSMSSYIVGSFVSWEDIPKSQDKYLILQDGLKTRDSSGNLIIIPKIRVGFDTKNIDNKTHFATAVGVEDLNSVIPKLLDPVEGVKTYKMGDMGTLSHLGIFQVIKPGDAISIVTLPDFKNQIDMVDSKGHKIAAILYMRRFDPKNEFKTELTSVDFPFQ